MAQYMTRLTTYNSGFQDLTIGILTPTGMQVIRQYGRFAGEQAWGLTFRRTGY